MEYSTCGSWWPRCGGMDIPRVRLYKYTHVDGTLPLDHLCHPHSCCFFFSYVALDPVFRPLACWFLFSDLPLPPPANTLAFRRTSTRPPPAEALLRPSIYDPPAKNPLAALSDCSRPV